MFNLEQTPKIFPGVGATNRHATTLALGDGTAAVELFTRTRSDGFLGFYLRKTGSAEIDLLKSRPINSTDAGFRFDEKIPWGAPGPSGIMVRYRLDGAATLFSSTITNAVGDTVEFVAGTWMPIPKVSFGLLLSVYGDARIGGASFFLDFAYPGQESVSKLIRTARFQFVILAE